MGVDLSPINTGTFSLFRCRKRPPGYATTFFDFREHFAEQNRVAVETFRPFRQVGIRDPHSTHRRFADGSIPASAMTARLLARSR